MRRRIFIRWVVVLSTFWVFANWPRHSGLANFFYSGGFPLTYAWGVRGEETHDLGIFALDVVIGVVAVLGLSYLCAWSRRLPSDN